MKCLKLLLLLAPLALFNGCQKQPLQVDTVYLGPETLASYWVGTPDPKKGCPDSGQQLILYWNLPAAYSHLEELRFRWTLRFGNYEEEVVEFATKGKKGKQVYSLLNERYWDRCGVQTWKVELLQGDCVIETLQNAVWTDLISISAEEETVEFLD